MATGQDADVIIVGAGIFGLACAWECRARGLSVLLIEQCEPAAGSSGGMVGTLAPHVPEGWSDRKQFQLSALLSAQAWWQSVDRASGLASGYGRIGRVQPLTSEIQRDRALRRIAGAARHWHGIASWQVGDTPWLEPAAAPFGAITDDLTARLDPLAACRSLARACLASGVRLLGGQAVSQVGDGWVRVGGQVLTAQHVVIAAGYASFGLLDAWLGPGSGRAVKGQAALLRATHAPGMPVIQGEGVYIVPHEDVTLGVGSTSEDDWQNPGCDHLLDDLLLRAAALWPPLAQAEILRRWSGLRPKARGRTAMVGPVPGCARLLVATGGFKTGFGIAHSCAEAVAALIGGTEPGLPPSFNPSYHLLPV